MATIKEYSREEFNSGEGGRELIKIGCLQRIADATEIMSSNYTRLIDERVRFERRFREEQESGKRLANQIRALKGVITKLKRK